MTAQFILIAVIGEMFSLKQFTVCRIFLLGGIVHAYCSMLALTCQYRSHFSATSNQDPLPLSVSLPIQKVRYESRKLFFSRNILALHRTALLMDVRKNRGLKSSSFIKVHWIE